MADKRWCSLCSTDCDFEVAWENSHVEAWENSHVEARENSHVVARENSHVVARENSHVEARENSHVEAWENSHVVARENSHVVARENSHVEAWENSHVEAWGNSHVVARENSHVVARENSHVEAWENSHVEAWGNSHVEACSAFVVIILMAASVVASGGKIVVNYEQSINPREWAVSCNATIDGDSLLLYKRVAADFSTQNGVVYLIGEEVIAPDWDEGHRECGYGLHFCPLPKICDDFRDNKSDRYVACSVKIADIVVHSRPEYPHKVKARACRVLYECDREGRRIEIGASR